MADPAASLSTSKGADAKPRHVAIIMDGNGRWAQDRGWPRLVGHLLHLLFPELGIVFRQVLGLALLDLVHAVAAQVADGDAGMFGILRGHAREVAAAFLVQLGDR